MKAMIMKTFAPLLNLISGSRTVTEQGNVKLLTYINEVKEEAKKIESNIENKKPTIIHPLGTATEGNCQRCGADPKTAMDVCDCQFAKNCSKDFEEILNSISDDRSSDANQSLTDSFIGASCEKCGIIASTAKANGGCRCVAESKLNDNCCSVCGTHIDVARRNNGCLCNPMSHLYAPNDPDYKKNNVTPLVTKEKNNVGFVKFSEKEKAPLITDPVIEQPLTPEQAAARKLQNMKDANNRYEIVEMLSYMRPAGSKTENRFISRWLVPLGVKFDKFGNAYMDVGEKPRVLWSSHTDTVHREEGRARVVMTDKLFAKLSFQEKNATCLGADDTIGVWLMLEMVRAGIQGRYIFHRSEEIGCLGSKWIADNTPRMLDGIDIAIAFDRRGRDDVITHQSTGRCCSDDFGRSLAHALNSKISTFNYSISSGGIVTDTAHYNRIIPECSNISVGYENAHSQAERTDLNFALDLRDALCRINTDDLCVKRDPSVVETRHYGGYQRKNGGYHEGKTYGYYSGYAWDEEEWNNRWKGNTETKTTATNPSSGVTKTKPHDYSGQKNNQKNKKNVRAQTKVGKNNKNRRVINVPEDDYKPSLPYNNFENLVELLQENPAEVADYLESLGVDYRAVERYIEQALGIETFPNI